MTDPVESAPALDDATTILLRASSVTPVDGCLCRKLLERDSIAGTVVVHVDLVTSPRERLRQWREDVNEFPATLGLVDVHSVARGVPDEATGAPGSTGSVRVERVSEPQNLTQIGMAITKLLDRIDTSERTVMCFHSLSALLHYTDVQGSFRFLNVLRGHLKSADATGHFHIEPGAHDEETVNRLRTNFDAVVEAAGDRVRVQST